MVKRKLEPSIDSERSNGLKKAKVRLSAPANVANKFRPGLFEKDYELQLYKEAYAGSKPYKHGVLRDLINNHLLESVLQEIQKEITFTEKETDIYRIYQSGDLANLDGLDAASLRRLPSLLKLRNALYSEPFRTYLSTITGAGPLSGKKTDMAINIYKPGSYLLCHDDVIGSRRVSYILYLTKEWKSEWGGALRLYPTEKKLNKKGHNVNVPSPDFSLSIPPSWNQMSFFAVQPGESYHDVEEVYPRGFRQDDDPAPDDRRLRVAISGWFHIPQPGESGYKKGVEEIVAKKSSLMQLKGQDTQFDFPERYPIPYPYYPLSAPQFVPPGSPKYETLKQFGWKLGPTGGHMKPLMDKKSDKWDGLSEQDCEFLLQFMNPHLLVPNRVRAVNREFTREQSIVIEDFLAPKFAQILKDAIQQEPSTVNEMALKETRKTLWEAAQPPHKRRFLYILPTEADPNKQSILPKLKASQSSPIKQLIAELFPSLQFRKWLGYATGLVARSHDLKARRFRRGLDYELATPYTEEMPRLELTLGITPDGIWEAEIPETAEGEELKEDQLPDPVRNGGEECYMAPLNDGADDSDDDDSDDDSDDDAMSESSDEESSSDEDSSDDSDGPAPRRKAPKAGGAPKSKPKSAPKAAATLKKTNADAGADDPAVYKAGDADEDDMLFHMAAGWNRLSLVTRDTGTMKYVRFVNTGAGADRWDVTGDYEVDWDLTDELELEVTEESDEDGGDEVE